MKKKIICLILTLATLTLALTSCGSFNFWEEDLSAYVKFDKEKFAATLLDKSITIKDGTFTTDPAIREQKVSDSIFTTLGQKTDKTDKLTVGTPDGHDLFYYAYYVTATVKGKDYVFKVDTMAKDKAEETQLGINFPSDLEGEILELYKDYTFVADEAYAPITSGNAEDGQLVFISYNRSYVDAAGKTHKVSATKHPMILDKANNPFADKLVGQSIGSKITSAIKVEIDKNDEKFDEKQALYGGEYTDVKIDWAVNKGAKALTFTETTYDEETKIAPTLVLDDASKIDLKDVELTYNVYPVSFVEVEEFTAEAVINTIYAENVTFSNIRTVIFGADFTEKTEEGQKAALNKYKFTVDGEEVTLEEFVTILDTAQQAVVDKEKANDTAKKSYDEKKEALDKAEAALKAAEDEVAKAGDKATEAQKKKVTDAKTARDTAKAAFETAKKTYEGTDGNAGSKAALEKAIKDRDKKVEIFFNKVSKDTVVNGYKENVVYEGLLNTYNTEIKENLAAEIFKLMKDKKFTTVNSLPEDAVSAAEEYLYQNYQYSYYKNVPLDDKTADEEETFYSKYPSFDEFLIKYAVPTDLEVTVKTKDEALAAIRKAAEEDITEKLIVYAVAKAYGKTATDEIYEAYIESEDYDYTKEAYNGAEAARDAFQFDTIMNYFLENKESDDGKFIRSWTRVKFTLEAADEDAADEEHDEHDGHDHD